MCPSTKGFISNRSFILNVSKFVPLNEFVSVQAKVAPIMKRPSNQLVRAFYYCQLYPIFRIYTVSFLFIVINRFKMNSSRLITIVVSIIYRFFKVSAI